MNQSTIQGIIVGVLVIIINICAFPVAAFSLFTTQEGTSIFSIDYLIAIGIQLAPNIIILQLIIALWKDKHPFIIAGWVMTMAEILLFLLMYQAELEFELFMYSGLIIVAITIVLLFKTIRSK